MCATTHSKCGLAVWRDLVHGLPEEFEIFEATRAVRVHHQEPPPAAVQHAMPHPAALPQVLDERDDTQVGLRVLRGELERRLGGAVYGPVVDDENLV